LIHGTTSSEATPQGIMVCLPFVFLRASSSGYWPRTDTARCLQLSLLSSSAAEIAHHYHHQQSNETILSTIKKFFTPYLFSASRHSFFQQLQATLGMTGSRYGRCDNNRKEMEVFLYWFLPFLLRWLMTDCLFFSRPYKADCFLFLFFSYVVFAFSLSGPAFFVSFRTASIRDEAMRWIMFEIK
jgi:hypothetical protein